MRWTKRQTRRERVALWSVVAVLGWSGIGQAQELAPPNEEGVPASDSVETPVPMSPWGSEHRWHYNTNRLAIEYLDLTPEGKLIALQSDGAVVTSKDGMVWTVLFDPGQVNAEEEDPESLLLEVEANFGELVEEPDLDEGTEDDTVGSFGRSAVRRFGCAGHRNAATGSNEKESTQRGPIGRVWSFGETSSSILVSRRDGRWYTDDFGAYWVQLNFLPSVYSLLELDGGEVLLGTSQGLWRLPVGGDWEPIGNRLSNLTVEYLAMVDDEVYAGDFRRPFRPGWSDCRMG